MIARRAVHRLPCRVEVALRDHVPALVIIVGDAAVDVLRAVGHRCAVRAEVLGEDEAAFLVPDAFRRRVEALVQHRLAPDAEVLRLHGVAARVVGVEHRRVAVRHRDGHPVRAVEVAAEDAPGGVIVGVDRADAVPIDDRLPEGAEVRLVRDVALVVPDPAVARIALFEDDGQAVGPEVALLVHVAEGVVAAAHQGVPGVGGAQLALAVEVALLDDAAFLVVDPLQGFVAALEQEGAAVRGGVAQVGRVARLVIASLDLRVALAVVGQGAVPVEVLLLGHAAVLVEDVAVGPAAVALHRLAGRADKGDVIAEAVRRICLERVGVVLLRRRGQAAVGVVAAGGDQDAVRVIVAELSGIASGAVHRLALDAGIVGGEELPGARIGVLRGVPAFPADHRLALQPQAPGALPAVDPGAADLAGSGGAGHLPVVRVQIDLGQAVVIRVEGVGHLGVALAGHGDAVLLVVVDLPDHAVLVVALVDDLRPALLAADKLLVGVIVGDAHAVLVADVVDDARIAQGGHDHQAVLLVVVVLHGEDVLRRVGALDGGVALVVLRALAVLVVVVFRHKAVLDVPGVGVAVVAAGHAVGLSVRAEVHLLHVKVLGIGEGAVGVPVRAGDQLPLRPVVGHLHHAVVLVGADVLGIALAGAEGQVLLGVQVGHAPDDVVGAAAVIDGLGPAVGTGRQVPVRVEVGLGHPVEAVLEGLVDRHIAGEEFVRAEGFALRVEVADLAGQLAEIVGLLARPALGARHHCALGVQVGLGDDLVPAVALLVDHRPAAGAVHRVPLRVIIGGGEQVLAGVGIFGGAVAEVVRHGHLTRRVDIVLPDQTAVGVVRPLDLQLGGMLRVGGPQRRQQDSQAQENPFPHRSIPPYR